MKSPGIGEKTRKNVIVHHYEYHYLPKALMDEIDKKEKELIELKKQLPARISIYLPNSHPIFETRLLNRNKVVEWSSHVLVDGKQKQLRELVYVQKVDENADIASSVHSSVLDAIDFSNEYYNHLECVHFGSNTILKLSGFDVKDLSKK